MIRMTEYAMTAGELSAVSAGTVPVRHKPVISAVGSNDSNTTLRPESQTGIGACRESNCCGFDVSSDTD